MFSLTIRGFRGPQSRDRSTPSLISRASRFYIEFIINANTIYVISYILMHISRGVFVCHVALHSIIYNSEPETRPERNPSTIIHIRTYSRRVIYAQNKCPTRSFFDQFCFSLYFFFFLLQVF